MSSPGTIISALQVMGVAGGLTVAVMIVIMAYQNAVEVTSLREAVTQQSAQLDRINARSSTHTKTTDRLID